MQLRLLATGLCQMRKMLIMSLLPDKYLYRDIKDITVGELCSDPALPYYEPLIHYFLTRYVYPQIKVPTKMYTSTPADLQAGFKAGVIFTATRVWLKLIRCS